MANSLVQQYAGPSRTKHYWHGASRRRLCLELHNGQPNRFTREIHRHVTFDKIIETGACAATSVALLTAAVLFKNDAHIESYQRPYISRHRAIGCHNQNQVLAACQTDIDLLHAIVECAGCGINFAQQRRFLSVIDTRRRVIRRIQTRAGAAIPDLH